MRKNKIENKYYLDKADLVQTIIIIAGLAVAAILAIGSVSSAVMSKGEETAKCINSSGNISDPSSGLKDCQGENEESIEVEEETGMEWKIYDENDEYIHYKYNFEIDRERYAQESRAVFDLLAKQPNYSEIVSDAELLSEFTKEHNFEYFNELTSVMASITPECSEKNGLLYVSDSGNENAFVCRVPK